MGCLCVLGVHLKTIFRFPVFRHRFSDLGGGCTFRFPRFCAIIFTSACGNHVVLFGRAQSGRVNVFLGGLCMAQPVPFVVCGFASWLLSRYRTRLAIAFDTTPGPNTRMSPDPLRPRDLRGGLANRLG